MTFARIGVFGSRRAIPRERRKSESNVVHRGVCSEYCLLSPPLVDDRGQPLEQYFLFEEVDCEMITIYLHVKGRRGVVAHVGEYLFQKNEPRWDKFYTEICKFLTHSRAAKAQQWIKSV